MYTNKKFIRTRKKVILYRKVTKGKEELRGINNICMEKPDKI